MRIIMLPTSKIIANLGLEPNGRVQRAFTHSCRIHMDKYIPMSDLESKGDLRTIIDEQPNCIIYESPYAGYQYYGMRKDGTRIVRNYTTPGTGTYWDKRMWSADKGRVLKEVQESFERGT